MSGSSNEESGRRPGDPLPVLVVGRAHRVAQALPAGPPAISADGRYVAFVSDSGSLVAGDRNETADVFVRDTVEDRTVLVSRSRTGGAASGYSIQPSISADGRVVAFTSSAADLVDADGNGTLDVFVHDLRTGQIDLISRGSNGELGDQDSFSPSISADGRHVAFASLATNLDPRDHNESPDVYLHDRETRHTTLVSVSSGGQVGDGPSGQPSVNADARVVAFTSMASNFDADDVNSNADVYLHDVIAGTTELVSRGADGRAGNGPSAEPALSADGTVVAFTSSADDLVPDDDNASDDVFTRSVTDGRIRAVSTAGDGRTAAGASHAPSISADGRRVAFLSDAADLTPTTETPATSDPDEAADHAFVRDLTGAGTALVGYAPGRVPGDGESSAVAVSPSGGHVAFTDTSTDLAGQPEPDGGDHLYIAPVRTAKVPRPPDRTPGA